MQVHDGVEGGGRETGLEEEILKKVDIGVRVGGGVGQQIASSPTMATPAPTSPTWRASSQKLTVSSQY